MKDGALPQGQRKKNSKGGRFLPALCSVLGILILLSVIATALPMTLPRMLGYEIFNVVSGSMSPAIPMGSVVYTETVAPEDIAEGDVIAFQSGESIITHRVVQNRVLSGEYVTKGDANPTEDISTVPYAALVGRVVFHLPVLGGLLAIYASTLGKVYLLVFAACGLMFNLLAGRLRSRQRDRLREKLEEDLRAPTTEKVEAVRQDAVRRRRVRRVAMLVALAVFCGCAAGAGTIWYQYRKGDALYAAAAARYRTPAVQTIVAAADEGAAAVVFDEDEQIEYCEPAPIQVDFQALQAESDDVIGWIYCPDTVIDYPVMQGDDNDYYLHRGYDGAYSVFGSIFADAANSPDFSDASTILYGHHMNNGSMFASLDHWADQEYYEAHSEMWLLTPQQDYKLVLVAGYTTAAESDTYTTFARADDAFQAYLADALSRSDFTANVEADPEGRYVMLSTCAYVFTNARYVIHAMLVPAASAGGVAF